METPADELKATVASTRRMTSRRRWSRIGIVLVLFAATLATVLLSQMTHSASAAAAPEFQCNNDTASNVGGQGIACTVTIMNYVDSGGAATAPSEITKTRCVGAAGPIAGGGGTCSTTTTTSAEPVTLVQQCNGSGNGGGGVVICSVTITNVFSSSPAVALAPANIYQCVGSFDTSAIGTCSPANTPGITSVGAATVGQCNGTGNGGGTSYACTVTGGSTMTTTLPVNVDQCNGSGNGGGALVECTAAVTNDVIPATPTTATTTLTPATGTTTPTTTGTTTPTTTGTTTPTTTGTTTPTTTGTTTPTTTGTTTPAPTGTTTPVATGTVTPVSTGTTIPTPLPPETGNAGSGGAGGSSQAVLWLLGITATVLTLGLVLAGLRIAPRERMR